MLHYYLQKGFRPEYILGLSPLEKLFFFASMEKTLEERKQLFSDGGKT